MFDEPKRPTGAERTVHLGERRRGIGDAAKRPGDDHRVDAAMGDNAWETFGRALKQPHSKAAPGHHRGGTLRHGQQFW